MSKLLLRLSVALLILVVLVGALWGWREHTLKRLSEKTQAELATAWENGDLAKARILAGHLEDPEQQYAWGQKLLEAEAAKAVERNDAAALRQIISQNPQRSLTEDEALLLARAAMHERDARTYESMTASWRDRQSQPAQWVFLEAAALTIQGQAAEAKAVLEAQKFQGRDESNRLLRLALLSTDQPLVSMELVNEAIAVAPEHADALSFRAQILERLRRWPEARADYVRAVALDSTSPLFWDQLAGFYQRRQQYLDAVQTWQDGYEKTGVAEFWLKAWFWKKVTGYGESMSPPPEHGFYAEFAGYLNRLEPGLWWDEATFSSVAFASRILEQRQETFWLRLLQWLQDDQDAEAMRLLSSDPFARKSWAPWLKDALRTILLWRAEQIPLNAGSLSSGEERHQFYGLLARLGDVQEPYPAMKHLLESRNAWAAAFLAEGWLAAAIQFDQPDGAALPGWYDYGQVQARRLVETNTAALERLPRILNSDEIPLLAVEIYLAEGQLAKAESSLVALAGEEGAVAERAAWLLAQLLYESNRLDELRVLLSENAALASSLAGQQLQARLALLDGRFQEAVGIYETIADESFEAKVFLSRLAFQQKQWERARELTEQLIALQPDEPIFYRNLRAINEAEGLQP